MSKHLIKVGITIHLCYKIYKLPEHKKVMMIQLIICPTEFDSFTEAVMNACEY